KQHHGEEEVFAKPDEIHGRRPLRHQYMGALPAVCERRGPPRPQKRILCRRMWTLRIIPTPRRLLTSDVPPTLANGRGRPVTGMTPSVMPTLIKMWPRSIDTTPVMIRTPKVSLA